MPSPTVEDLNDRLTAASAIAWAALSDLRGDLPALLDTLLGEAATVNSSPQGDAGTAFLQFAAGLLGEPAAALLSWSFFDYAYAAEQRPAAGLAEAIRRTIDYFAANDVYVTSRGIAFGTITAGGSNVGNGVVQRQTVDERGQEIEAVTLEDKRLECVGDARVGLAGTSPATNREAFLLDGEPLNRYGLDVTGSGIDGAGLSVADVSSDNVLANALMASATFATAPSAGSPQAPTAVTSWTFGTLAKITCSVDDLPRLLPVTGTTAYKIVFGTSGGTADNSVTQAATAWTARLPDNAPVHAEVWLRRRSSANGTGTLTLGSQTATVDVTTLTNDVWTRLRLSDGTSSKNWPAVWNQNAATFAFALSSNSTGTLEVAFPMLCGMSQIDGTWWRVLPGTTPFVVGDEFTVTDALDSTDARVQQLVARLFNAYLPHTAPATQVTASGGRTLTFAAAGDTVTASSGSFVSDGYKIGMRLVVAGTTSNNGTFAIVNVSATVITVAAGFADEGPLSATATLDGLATIAEPA